MERYYYDLHIHSCLSPCADDDNTPNNILGMASLAGINVLALTDHNSTQNCPAFFKAAKNYGIIPIAGMELTTAEDIHIICLFETLESAEAFEKAIAEHKIPYKNKKEIFGDQLLVNECDEVIGEEEYLLINATLLSLEEAVALARLHGALVYPAHIDREANGIIATLGTFPDKPYFACAELNDAEKLKDYQEKYALDGKKIVISSDAHHLWDINEADNLIMIDDEPYSSSLVRKRLFEYLNGCK